MAMPGQMSPDNAMLDYFMEMGQLAPEQERIARQRTMANQLRQGSAMTGMRDAGRAQVAQHPLEALNAVAGSVGGAYMNQQADQATQGLQNARGDAMRRVRQRSMPGMGPYYGAGTGNVDAMADPRTMGEI